jgi:ATP-dependent DNA ligase
LVCGSFGAARSWYLARIGKDFHVRYRRGWNMTELLPELAGMPAVVCVGELVALGDGEPYFPDVCSRLLNGGRTIPLVYIVFDLLEQRGRSLLDHGYRERRALLAGARSHAGTVLRLISERDVNEEREEARVMIACGFGQHARRVLRDPRLLTHHSVPRS